jgi:hypothetical protein
MVTRYYKATLVYLRPFYVILGRTATDLADVRSG